MKLPKAIEILSLILNEFYNSFPQDDKDALKLGIEALKRIREKRAFYDTRNPELLPGEDPE